MENKLIIKTAQDVINTELAGIKKLSKIIDSNFSNVIKKCLQFQQFGCDTDPLFPEFMISLPRNNDHKSNANQVGEEVCNANLS